MISSLILAAALTVVHEDPDGTTWELLPAPQAAAKADTQRPENSRLRLSQANPPNHMRLVRYQDPIDLPPDANPPVQQEPENPPLAPQNEEPLPKPPESTEAQDEPTEDPEPDQVTVLCPHRWAGFEPCHEFTMDAAYIYHVVQCPKCRLLLRPIPMAELPDCHPCKDHEPEPEPDSENGGEVQQQQGDPFAYPATNAVTTVSRRVIRYPRRIIHRYPRPIVYPHPYGRWYPPRVNVNVPGVNVGVGRAYGGVWVDVGRGVRVRVGW